MKKVLLPLLIFFGLAFFGIVKAENFIDNFDYFILGNVNGQGSWEVSGSTASVSDIRYYSADKSLHLNNTGYTLTARRNYVFSNPNVLYFKAYLISTGEFNIGFENGQLSVIKITGQNGYIYDNESHSFIQFAWSIPYNQWIDISLTFNNITQKFFATIDGQSSNEALANTGTPSKIWFNLWYSTEVYIDDVSVSAPSGCILYIQQIACNQAGCYWCQSGGNFYCSYAPFGDYCNQPNEGNPIIFTSFDDYYAANADTEDFPTPSALITSLSSFVQDIVDSVSGFFTNFQFIFNLETAQARGNELGLVIPTARGFLIPVNDFFGGFPLADLFIFVILILVVVILFRGITRIWQAIRG